MRLKKISFLEYSCPPATENQMVAPLVHITIWNNNVRMCMQIFFLTIIIWLVNYNDDNMKVVDKWQHVILLIVIIMKL